MSDPCLQDSGIGWFVDRGSDDATRNAIEKALRRIDWFQVLETRGHVADGKTAPYQVTVKVGFRLESS